jgi:hypothetical protein
MNSSRALLYRYSAKWELMVDPIRELGLEESELKT